MCGITQKQRYGGTIGELVGGLQAYLNQPCINNYLFWVAEFKLKTKHVVTIKEDFFPLIIPAHSTDEHHISVQSQIPISIFFFTFEKKLSFFSEVLQIRVPILASSIPV